MGDILGSVFGGGERQEQKTTPDKTARALNQLRLEQLSSLFAGTPFASFAEPSSAFTPTEETMGLLSELFSGSSLSDLPMTFDDYIDLGLSQGSNYINQVAAPEIMSMAALAGLEGGGVVPESIAKATASIAMPFLSTLPGFSISSAMLPAQMASSLLPLSDFPRALKEQDLLRRQGVVTTGLTGLPFTPGSQTIGATRQPSIFENFFGTGSSTGSTFGGSGGGFGGFLPLPFG